MYTATQDVLLPTTIAGSLPRPAWYTENLAGRPFRAAMSDRRFREQYLDAVSSFIRDQDVVPGRKTDPALAAEANQPTAVEVHDRLVRVKQLEHLGLEGLGVHYDLRLDHRRKSL